MEYEQHHGVAIIACLQWRLFFQEAHGVAGIDYAYMNVRSLDDAEVNESLSTTDMWILQQEQHSVGIETHVERVQAYHCPHVTNFSTFNNCNRNSIPVVVCRQHLLSTLISPNDLRHLVVMICLDLSEVRSTYFCVPFGDDI